MTTVQTCSSKARPIEQILVYGFRAYVTPVIIVFGLIGNTLVITAFARMQRKSPCRFNMYAIAIAVAHTLELIFNAFLDDFLGRGLYWLSDCSLYLKVDVHSDFMCKFISYVPKTAALISTSLLIVFSIDRVLTVYKPLQFRGDHRLRTAGFGISFVYLISFMLYLPLPIQSGITINSEQSGVLSKECVYLDPLNIGTQYTLYLHIFGSNIIPSTIVLITNVMIFLKLRDLFRERTRLCMNMERSSAETRRVLGHLGMTTIFSVIMLPILIAILLRQHADYHNYHDIYPEYEKKLVQLSKLFSSVESIYFVTEFPTFYIFLPMFRSELRHMFTRPCARKPTDNVAQRLVKFTPRVMQSFIGDQARTTPSSSIRGTLIESVNTEDTNRHSLNVNSATGEKSY
ncbi:unnamed protein product [Echinostoma caproni]|uniref:G_PROTEIN_RECEP_F1_2 domain-containing protein n=1 Tax=Echinostoma caproni TaxID=27848 RepID=A0A183A620_9TREM|nr:unnamed protein product [Echinostoma caproni]